MSLSSREEETQRRYNSQAGQWMKASGGIDRAWFWPEELEALVALVPTGVYGIEVGCGPATD